MVQRKIKIIETYYDEKRDLVQWLVEDVEANKKLVLCWPGCDLGPAVGVDAELTPELIKGFCNEIAGKTINLVSEAKGSEIDVSGFGNMVDEESEEQFQLDRRVQEAHNILDQYPYREILDSLAEQGQFKDALEEVKEKHQGGSLSDFVKARGNES